MSNRGKTPTVMMYLSLRYSSEFTRDIVRRLDADLKWMIGTGVVAGAFILSMLNIEVGRHLDTRCSHIEQCCTDMDSRIQEISMRH